MASLMAKVCIAQIFQHLTDCTLEGISIIIFNNTISEYCICYANWSNITYINMFVCVCVCVCVCVDNLVPKALLNTLYTQLQIWALTQTTQLQSIMKSIKKYNALGKSHLLYLL